MFLICSADMSSLLSEFCSCAVREALLGEFFTSTGQKRRLILNFYVQLCGVQDRRRDWMCIPVFKWRRSLSALYCI